MTKVERLRVEALVLEFRDLFIGHAGAVHALTEELGRVRVDLEWDDIRGRAVDRLFVGVVEVRKPEIAIEQAARAAADHLDGGRGQTDLETVEPIEYVSVDIVDAAMGLVRNNQVEEAGVERLTDLHHRRVCRQVNTVLALVRRCGSDDRGGVRGEAREGVFGLLPQLPTVAKEKDALRPIRVSKQFCERDGHARLAGPSRLNDERLPTLALELFRDALDSVQLIEPVDYVALWRQGSQRLAVSTSENQLLQAVLGVEAIDLARGVSQRVIPEPNLVAVGIDNDWTTALILFETIGIEPRLNLAVVGIDGSSLGLNDSQWHSVVVPKYVVDISLGGSGGLMTDLDLLADRSRARSAISDIPTG